VLVLKSVEENVGHRLLVTGAGTGASINLMRGLRAADPSFVIVGCHSDRFVLAKSTADRNYLTLPATDRGFLRTLERVIRQERVDLLMPTSDAEVSVLARSRARVPCRLFLPRPSVIELCQDKYRLNLRLRRVGVPAPVTYAVTSLRTLERTFRRLPTRSLAWCRIRAGSGSLGAIPVRSLAQARSWIEYWRDMRGVPPTAFTLSEYLPGRDFSCQALWKDGTPILVKTLERLSYVSGGSNPSRTSSVAHLAKTVNEPRVVDVCARAIRAIDPAASGTFNLDVRENAGGVPCITEINAGRFPSGFLLHDLTGKHSVAATFVSLALGEPVELRDEYDAAEGWYSVRDLDTAIGIFHSDELFDRIEDARG
jgi:carbamoylphosphate synthase large subunit